jgi:exodeoxyribonuclease VII small subunit
MTDITATDDAAAETRLSRVLARLDEIRRNLDRDDLDLEDQLVLYREGCTLVGTAKQILNTVRAEVDILMQETESAPVRGV